jgi:hypothetical protein
VSPLKSKIAACDDVRWPSVGGNRCGDAIYEANEVLAWVRVHVGDLEEHNGRTTILQLILGLGHLSRSIGTARTIRQLRIAVRTCHPAKVGTRALRCLAASILRYFGLNEAA